MKTCPHCGNQGVGGHLVESSRWQPGWLTTEYECGHCGHWWLENNKAGPKPACGVCGKLDSGGFLIGDWRDGTRKVVCYECLDEWRKVHRAHA